MAVQRVLIDGAWRESAASGEFQAENPATKTRLEDRYPISNWADCDAALAAAARAAAELRSTPAAKLADFLDQYAGRIEGEADKLVPLAQAETALPTKPRLADVELPRTVSQLRQAGQAARDGSWAMPTIDTKLSIRSVLGPIGPVWVFGPNNFPFAFNSVAGGDFAAAIAAGNPVIAKANSSHPGTSRLLAELAHEAAEAVGLPRGTVQMIYRTSHEDGERCVSESRTAATGYTGSRTAGLKLKAAADRTGKLFYAELSSINPVVILPGAIAERGAEIAGEFAGSCLMGTGQFCTNPGMVVLVAGGESHGFISAVAEKFKAAPPGILLSQSVARSLSSSIEKLQAAGAETLAGGKQAEAAGYSFANTLLRVSADKFLARAEEFQTEAFGNSSLVVVANSVDQAAEVLEHLEGNLTGCVYSDTKGSDDDAYDKVASRLRQRVGRLLNDKMPTGVAVSLAMNHGGPFPATTHPGFTAVGIPASVRRFAMLECYDNVRPHRLPPALQNKNPTGTLWRMIDGAWTQADVK